MIIKKLRALVALLFFVICLAVATPSMAQTRSDENTDPYHGSSQRDEKGNPVSRGWIGLLGLAGLLGLRRKATGTRLRTLVLVTSLLAAEVTLYYPTPGYSQASEKGYDGDNTVKTSQRDTEDVESNFDWIGFFGLAGLVGLVGPRRVK